MESRTEGKNDTSWVPLVLGTFWKARPGREWTLEYGKRNLKLRKHLGLIPIKLAEDLLPEEYLDSNVGFALSSSVTILGKLFSHSLPVFSSLKRVNNSIYLRAFMKNKIKLRVVAGT